MSAAARDLLDRVNTGPKADHYWPEFFVRDETDAELSNIVQATGVYLALTSQETAGALAARYLFDKLLLTLLIFYPQDVRLIRHLNSDSDRALLSTTPTVSISFSVDRETVEIPTGDSHDTFKSWYERWVRD